MAAICALLKQDELALAFLWIHVRSLCPRATSVVNICNFSCCATSLMLVLLCVVARLNFSLQKASAAVVEVCGILGHTQLYFSMAYTTHWLL